MINRMNVYFGHLLAIFFIVSASSSFGIESITKVDDCLDAARNERVGSQCICYRGKGECSSDSGTCVQLRCERRSCERDRECAQFSAKCLNHFCRMSTSEDKVSEKISLTNRACDSDQNCEIISTACACIHNSTCARSDDLKNAFVDAVNKVASKNYMQLAKCSADEQKSCIGASPCVRIVKWNAICEKHSCSPHFAPIAH
jgi:hypothetical protein